MTQIVETSPATTELVIVAEQNDLPLDRAQPLLDSFQPLFVSAQELIQQARDLKVTDATQLTEMKQARAMRLQLKDVRVSVEKLRRSLKEESVRTGKAIDGMANVLKFLIEPVEARLEEAEKFAERAEAQRKSKLKASREELLAPFMADTTFYDLSNMPEETFAQLLDSSRLAHESRLAAAKKAEEDRIAAEQARIAEEKRIREENERLRKEAEEQAKAAAAERAKAEAVRKAIEEKARKEREAIQAKAEAQRKEAEAKAAEERRKLEAAAAEERAKAARLEAEAKAKAEAEAAKKRAEEAAKRKAARAPDKTKIQAVARALAAIELPTVTTAEATDVLRKIRSDILDLASRIEHLADAL